MFPDHHIISTAFTNSNVVLQQLTDRGLFNLNAEENIISLPSTRSLAQELGQTAHNGVPLASY